MGRFRNDSGENLWLKSAFNSIDHMAGNLGNTRQKWPKAQQDDRLLPFKPLSPGKVAAYWENFLALRDSTKSHIQMLLGLLSSRQYGVCHGMHKDPR
jgi:hypothetical protein